MKYFYMNNGNLYSSEVPICGEEFTEITKEEYDAKLLYLQSKRETGVPAAPLDEWEQENSATEADYIGALESLGVEFGG